MFALEFLIMEQFSDIPMCGVDANIDVFGNGRLRILNNVPRLLEVSPVGTWRTGGSRR